MLTQRGGDSPYVDAFGTTLNLAHKALLHGAERKGDHHVWWDLAGGCHSPKGVLKTARTQLESGARHKWVKLELSVKCRGCKHCLKMRRRMWGGRGRDEYQAAEERGDRSMLVTLTFNSDAQYLLEQQAIERYERETGFAWDAVGKGALTPADKKKRITAQGSYEVTKYLKRLRNFPRDDYRRKIQQFAEANGLSTRGKVIRDMVAHGAFGATPEPYRFRYYGAAELHSGGGKHHDKPHFHMVIHELGDDVEILNRALQEKWSHGFVNAKLIHDATGAEYAAKYLGKDRLVRVRASRGYGRTETTSCHSLRSKGVIIGRVSPVAIPTLQTPKPQYPPTKGETLQNPVLNFPLTRLLH